MAYRVVCISPTDGSAGEQVGPVVARELGFQLVNEEIVEQVAREAGVGTEAVADVERRKSLVHRLVARLTDVGPAGVSGAPGAPGATAVALDPAPLRETLRDLIGSVLQEIAGRGDAVIVTHAASLALAKRTDVLRVFVSASPQTRARRLAEAQNIGAAEAEKLVARGDANRADYLKRFYDVSNELPTDYDVVLNTDHVRLEDAVALIVVAARSHHTPA